MTTGVHRGIKHVSTINATLAVLLLTVITCVAFFSELRKDTELEPARERLP